MTLPSARVSLSFFGASPPTLLVVTGAVLAGVLCGVGLTARHAAPARAVPLERNERSSALPEAKAPVVPPRVTATAPPEAPSEPAAGSDHGTEVDAVVETAAAASLAPNTPMAEGDAALHLARAWHQIFNARPSEQTLAVLWAQWAHEIARGQRMHAYNFAGIKGRGPTGASVVVWTREGVAPSDLVKRTFRAYRSAGEGARDYMRLLATRYPQALRAARDGNVYGFVSALDTGGYFTADTRAYLRAVTSLSNECRRRGISVAAIAGGTRAAL
ncbi:MAG TPA: glucosaminidase domain-containing protein [Polyangiaceae bacterium]|nr:glucosaminidase domain-containing protein [Polyangiaceae bacterium]